MGGVWLEARPRRQRGQKGWAMPHPTHKRPSVSKPALFRPDFPFQQPTRSPAESTAGGES